MAHYTEKNPISEQAWMDSVLRQIRLKSPSGLNESDHDEVLERHKVMYKKATESMDDAETLDGKKEGEGKQHDVIQSLADSLGVDYFDAYDMLEKENDEAGLTPGYEPPKQKP